MVVQKVDPWVVPWAVLTDATRDDMWVVLWVVQSVDLWVVLTDATRDDLLVVLWVVQWAVLLVDPLAVLTDAMTAD